MMDKMTAKNYILEGKTVLGIELGSTRIKGVLLDENHEMLAQGGFSWENRLENGIWTYHMDEVWTGLQACFAELKANVKKEDVVTKKEVRLTSSYAKENLSVDDVRKKAYGSLSDDLVKELSEEKKEAPFEVEKHDDDNENLLVDLSNDEDKPAVKEVTMGDALEYFEDLGLEYNVDYVDASKEKGKNTLIRNISIRVFF